MYTFSQAKFKLFVLELLDNHPGQRRKYLQRQGCKVFCAYVLGFSLDSQTGPSPWPPHP